MSKFVRHLNRGGEAATRRSYSSEVKAINFARGAAGPEVELKDGRIGPGCCLGCSEPACMQRVTTPKTSIRLLSEFPQEPITDLCPTNAITLADIAVVNKAACIGCGLCVSRCPFGAISLTAEGIASVTQDDPSKLATDKRASRIIDEATRGGVMRSQTLPINTKFLEAMRTLSDAVVLRFVANAFSALGVDARVRRRGDTNIRIDGLLGFSDGKVGVLEIERTNNAVESPRALLEDIAILHSRYKFAIRDIYPISVLLTLPNARSEYYQVMQDIEKVLGIQCRTITIGALMTMIWRFGKMTSLNGLFLTTNGGVDMRASIAAIVGQQVEEPYPAAFLTVK